MINMPPPAAYHQTIDLGERRRDFLGYSPYAKQTSGMLQQAVAHLLSTPATAFTNAIEEDYPLLPPQGRTTMRVKIKHIGVGKPLPFNESRND